MSSIKRSFNESNGSAHKKLKTGQNINLICNKNTRKSSEEAFDYLQSLFPKHVFNDRIPPIIWRHQLYAICATNRTEVDRYLKERCDCDHIRLIRLGSAINSNDTAIVLLSDYEQHIYKLYPKTIVIERFMKVVLDRKCDTSFTGDQLKTKYQLNSENIGELKGFGLLASHPSTLNTFLLSLPNAGLFVKHCDIGKKFILSLIKKSKYKELSKTDILKRKLPKDTFFSIEYLLYDLIGSDVIQSIQTSTDTLFRI